jgi:hypothetical protein
MSRMDMTVPYTHTTSLTFTLDECNVGEVVSPASVAADRDEAGGTPATSRCS